MALPADLAKGTFSGTLLDDTGAPLAATVTIKSGATWIADPDGAEGDPVQPGAFVLQRPGWTIELDGAGKFSQEVIASIDNPGATMNWTYTITVTPTAMPGVKPIVLTIGVRPGQNVKLQNAVSVPAAWTPNAAVGSGSITSGSITDAGPVGVFLIKAGDAAAVRDLIGAGTSNLALGTTAGTAKDGSYQPAWAGISDKPTTFPPSLHAHPFSEIGGVSELGERLASAPNAAAARVSLGIVDGAGLTEDPAHPGLYLIGA